MFPFQAILSLFELQQNTIVKWRTTETPSVNHSKLFIFLCIWEAAVVTHNVFYWMLHRKRGNLCYFWNYKSYLSSTAPFCIVIHQLLSATSHFANEMLSFEIFCLSVQCDRWLQAKGGLVLNNQPRMQRQSLYNFVETLSLVELDCGKRWALSINCLHPKSTLCYCFWIQIFQNAE